MNKIIPNTDRIADGINNTKWSKMDSDVKRLSFEKEVNPPSNKPDVYPNISVNTAPFITAFIWC